MKIKFLNQKSAECAGSGIRASNSQIVIPSYFRVARCAFCGKQLGINALTKKFAPHQWE